MAESLKALAQGNVQCDKNCVSSSALKYEYK